MYGLVEQGLLADAKENTGKLTQKMDDFDAAQKRFLGHKRAPDPAHRHQADLRKTCLSCIKS